MRLIRYLKKFKLEFLALAFALGFVKIQDEAQVLGKAYVYKLVNYIRLPQFKLAATIRLTALTVILLVVFVPMFQAFEAHIVNVTAEPILIEPPIITPGEQDANLAFILETDTDATHVYFTFGAGTDPNTVTDPICGDLEGGPIGPSFTVDVTEETVVKAIACDGASGSAHHSIITTQVFAHEQLQQLQVLSNVEDVSENQDESNADETLDEPETIILPIEELEVDESPPQEETEPTTEESTPDL